MLNIAIILGAGQGWRLQAGTPKAFVNMFGKPMLYYSISAFLATDEIDVVMVILPTGYIRVFDKMMDSLLEVEVPVHRISGADTRYKSLKKAIKQLESEYEPDDIKNANILVHNAANPLVTIGEIEQVLETLKTSKAAGVATPLHDTLRKIKRTKTETVDRENLWRMQTPQGLKYEVLKEGIKLMKDDPTDDLAIAEIQGIKPKLIMSRAQNFKVTTQEDLELMETLIAANREFKAGIGEDSHRFAEDGDLILGGVKFPKYPKLEADSDGDIMIHSLITALLQALGLGSLGPFADPMLDEGITDSKMYLDKMLSILEDEDWVIDQVEFIFECSEPKIDPMAKKLIGSISLLCGIDQEKISIAAHTGDQLTSFGRGEGIRCQCLVTLIRLWV